MAVIQLEVGLTHLRWRPLSPAAEQLQLDTHLGSIAIVLRPDAAPNAVSYLKGLVDKGVYDGCKLYRAEPPGETLDDGQTETRAGYALVQGGAYSCGKQQANDIAVEPKLKLTRGTVALITGTSEFFISLEAHPDWDGSFTLKRRESWETLDKIVALPTRQETHPSGTVLRILVDGVTFNASVRLVQ
eukprot:SM000021S06484  [mRNA]  locus=s21:557759:559528:- [translate_table: standard]